MKVNLYVIIGLLLCSAVIFAQTNEGQGARRAFEIPKDMRAISIGAAEVMPTATNVKPGDHVDILATYRDTLAKQEVTKMLMQNVLVLAVNRRSTDPSRKDIAGGSLTLAVMPEQTELITAADRAGALRIQLRPAEEITAASSEKTSVNITVTPPSRQPGIGDFWLPGEFQRLLEQRKQQRRQGSE